MTDILEFIRQPWPWYVAGPMIATGMLALLLFGNSFGISANLRAICSMVGAGKHCDFFDFNWKNQIWNLVLIAGLAIGGLIAQKFLTSSTPMELAPAVVAELSGYGIESSGTSLVPESIFSFESLTSVRGFLILVLGGFLVGFGSRYAGGCTSGHAISGLSNLQIPSLIAVVGFFIGGLFITYLVLPHLLVL